MVLRLLANGYHHQTGLGLVHLTYTRCAQIETFWMGRSQGVGMVLNDVFAEK